MILAANLRSGINVRALREPLLADRFFGVFVPAEGGGWWHLVSVGSLPRPRDRLRGGPPSHAGAAPVAPTTDGARRPGWPATTTSAWTPTTTRCIPARSADGSRSSRTWTGSRCSARAGSSPTTTGSGPGAPDHHRPDHHHAADLLRRTRIGALHPVRDAEVEQRARATIADPTADKRPPRRAPPADWANPTRRTDVR